MFEFYDLFFGDPPPGNENFAHFGFVRVIKTFFLEINILKVDNFYALKSRPNTML